MFARTGRTRYRFLGDLAGAHTAVESARQSWCPRDVTVPHYADFVGVRECWFCAALARAGDQVRVDLSRDVQDTFIGIGIYTRATVTWVDVPRCRRCRIGHGIERMVFSVLVASAASTGLMLLAWAASAPWQDQWQLALPVLWTLGWLLLWSGVRQHWFSWRWLAPRPQRHAREYPAVEELTEDGWN